MAATRKTSPARVANRKLANALRSYGLTPNGVVWLEAKKLVREGLSPKQAARLVRSTMPEAQQAAAIAKAPKVVKATASQKATLPPQAQRVRDGKVMRDSKGRIVARDVQEAYEALASLNG